MKKYLRLIYVLVFLYGCLGKTDSDSENITQPNEERVMSTDDIPPFANEEAEENYFKGNDARNLSNYEEAKDYYLKAYKLDPSHIVNLNNLANCLLMLDEVSEAEKYFKIAFSTDPSYGMTYANYTNFALVNKEYDLGISIGKTGLEKSSDSLYLGIINANLSILYAYKKECDSAHYYLNEARKLENYLDQNAIMSVIVEVYSECE